jgi:hypothetical protein
MEDAFSALVVIAVIFFRVVLPVLKWFGKQQAAGKTAGGGGEIAEQLRALRDAVEAMAQGGPVATAEQLGSAQRRLDALVAQGEGQLSRVPDEGATAVIALALTRPTLADLGLARDRVLRALEFLATADEASQAGFLRNDRTLAAAKEAAELGEARLALLAEAAMSRQRELAETMADADAFAAALVQPLRDFAFAHGLPLPPNQPISLPTAPGQEAMIRGLFADHPVFFVPRDFGEHIHRWPAVAHEVGHVLWDSEPTLRRELRALVPTSEQPWLPRPVQDRLIFNYEAAFAGWLEEIVCDAFAIILLGPAGFRGLVQALNDRARPMSAVFAAPDRTGQMLDEHPPPHLRVHMAAWLLNELGYDVEMKPLLAAWQQAHEDADYIVVPIAGTRQTVSVDLASFLDKGTYSLSELVAEEFRGLGGYPLSAVAGQELGPGVWARVKRRADQILAGEPFHDSPRVAIAAGIEAAAISPSSTNKIAAAVRAVIVGHGQRMTADPNFRGHVHEEPVGANRPLARARDAILLWELLERPHATGHERAPARSLVRHPPRGRASRRG